MLPKLLTRQRRFHPRIILPLHLIKGDIIIRAHYKTFSLFCHNANLQPPKKLLTAYGHLRALKGHKRSQKHISGHGLLPFATPTSIAEGRQSRSTRHATGYLLRALPAEALAKAGFARHSLGEDGDFNLIFLKPGGK